MCIKQCLSVFLISFFAISNTNIVQAATDINDVSSTNPQFNAIYDLVQNKAITLDNFSNFRPDDPINRVSFLKAAFTYIDYQPEGRLNYHTGFLDVPDQSWFAPYVKRAQEVRLFPSLPGTNFQPGETINRQEGLLITTSLYGIPTPFSQPSTAELFEDIRPTRIYSYLYKAAKDNQIFFINDPDYFRPSRPLTRADAAELLYRTKIAQASVPGGAILPETTLDRSDYNTVENELFEENTFEIFLDTWNRINNDFIYQEQINRDKLIYGAISGMVNNLNDPYSTFQSPDEFGESFIYVPIDYEGIGAVIEYVDNNYVIQTTLNNSPAFRSGLKANDIILEIDGKNVQNLTPEEVTGLIKGKAGTIVRLKILRGNETLNFSITRAQIDLQSIHAQVMQSDVLYIRIDQFTEDSYKEFDTIIDTLVNDSINGMIIDIRNNPGGYLTTTQNILNHFLDEGEAQFHTVDVNNTLYTFTSAGPGELASLDIIVLINEGSASAAEILAGALKDHGVAQIVGKSSFGKGSVQEITNYPDSSSLKLTIAKWLTPNKLDVSKIGIAPDIEVELSPEAQRNNQDPQLDAALKQL